MINVKSVSISAATGFILSFLVGIICGNAFISVLLRAFISALVFSAVAAGSSFLYSQFLSADGLPSEPSSRPQAKTSGKVDLVIDDDPLEEEENGPKFFVENNRSALQSDAKPSAPEKVDPDEDVIEDIVEEAADVSDVQPVGAPAAAPVNPVTVAEPEITAPPKAMDAVPKNDAAFTPVNLAASAPQVSASPEGTPAEEQLPEVDSLPDIEDLDTGKKDGEIGDIINDSEFATSGKSSGGTQFPDGQTAGTQNADVMAQAIRTILSKDN